MNHPEYKDTIKSIPIFSELSINQLRKISDIGSIRKYLKGENLFRTGDKYFGFFILLKGFVKVYDLNKEGKETVIHIVKPVNVFADIPLFEGSNYPVSAEAIEESILLYIPKDAFINLIRDNPKISLRMLAGFAKRMKSLVKQIEDLSSKEVINRLAEYIIKEVKKSGTENLPEPFIKLIAPKSVIASYLGTITETFSRTLNKLQSEEVIRVRGKKIFVTNFSALKKIARE